MAPEQEPQQLAGWSEIRVRFNERSQFRERGLGITARQGTARGFDTLQRLPSLDRWRSRPPTSAGRAALESLAEAVIGLLLLGIDR